MIFICTGTQHFQFNRLLKEVDRLINVGAIEEEVIAQTGFSSYVPQNYMYDRFFDSREMQTLIDRADLVISHAGSGTVINALRKGKKVIAVPRRAEFKEHLDDHQKQLADALEQMKYVLVCNDISDLEELVRKAGHYEFASFRGSPFNLAEDIRSFLNSEETWPD